MRIFYIGCVSFSSSALCQVIKCGGNVVGVATKSKSSLNTDHCDLAPVCVENNIPFKYVKDINAEHIIKWINTLNPDIIFVFGWSSLITTPLLNIPPMGVLGFHPTKLPYNRGRHPIIWAIALGLKSTASTFFFINEGTDSGEILSQADIPINDNDNAQELYNKITHIALNQIKAFLPSLSSGKYLTTPQNHSKANYWRKRKIKDGRIDFRMSSKAIYNLVRALSKPYVGAHIETEEESIKVWSVKISSCKNKNLEPGKVISVDENIIKVKTYDGAILLVDHEFTKIPNINTYL